jgi:hypothetical protein
MNRSVFVVIMFVELVETVYTSIGLWGLCFK